MAMVQVLGRVVIKQHLAFVNVESHKVWLFIWLSVLVPTVQTVRVTGVAIVVDLPVMEIVKC